ncbi:MFS general substrate transporter [Eremomyces bilateralis CBS 781.70]|uniref:MFS general substrate transporter n=1 Tax=Eremomyces bilateralis CBS 781.70 TaxID=1392243 RepID=A0A6G1GGT0_9PEZI|nr:MFS general substrate transporter [Eremomyces bilateralis CBS 781.70]KAF1817111.1 MFS general substrate transporter [Eremomyces bilateralis CBS 781.70]
MPAPPAQVGGVSEYRDVELDPIERPQQQNGEAEGENIEVSNKEKSELERLGRQRPDRFKTLLSEILFCFSITMSQALTEYFVSGFTVIVPSVTTALDIPRASQTWPASAFSLVVSSFLLVFGRLADMWGGYPLYVAGMAWLTIWSIVAGFAQNEIMLDVARAMQGLGPAAYLPAGLMLLGSVYRPGPRKNIVFSIYGAMAPLGFFIGIFFAGVAGQYTTWRWYFFIGAILSGLTVVISLWSIPSDIKERRGMGIKMDWPGAILTSIGLILVVFSITQSSHASQRWGTPYIYAILIVGVLCLVAAFFAERKVAMPLLPRDLFAVKYMKPLMLALFFSYGSFGIFLLYGTLYMTDIMSGEPMQLVAWFTPMAFGGCVIATGGGFIMHMVPGTVLILFSGIAWIIAPLLFAIAPPGANYWAYTFPSMICATIAIDITFNVTNIFITTSLPLARQGLAGAIINSLVQLGIATMLGFTDVIVTYTTSQKEDLPPIEELRRGYKTAFWYEVACAGFALVVLICFVRMQKAKSELTADERRVLEEACEEERRASRISSAGRGPSNA